MSQLLHMENSPPLKPKRSYALEPIQVTLNRGVYFWCACGYSKKQPFCDGSHRMTNLQGMRFTITEEEQVVFLCACKHTKNPPFCDGTHKSLAQNEDLSKKKS